MGKTVHFIVEATSVLGFLVFGTHCGLHFIKAEPTESAWVSLEAAGSQVLERTGAVPRTLVVAIEGFPLGVESNSSRRPDPACRGDHLSVLADPYAPTAVGNLAAEGSSQAEYYPHVALRVELGAKGILLVIT